MKFHPLSPSFRHLLEYEYSRLFEYFRKPFYVLLFSPLQSELKFEFLFFLAIPLHDSPFVQSTDFQLECRHLDNTVFLHVHIVISSNH